MGIWPFFNLYCHPNSEDMGLGPMRSRFPCSDGRYLTYFSNGGDYAHQ